MGPHFWPFVFFGVGVAEGSEGPERRFEGGERLVEAPRWGPNPEKMRGPKGQTRNWCGPRPRPAATIQREAASRETNKSEHGREREINFGRSRRGVPERENKRL